MPSPSSQIELGATGELAGQSYNVAGRIRMSMEQDGQIYYWTEYHLVGPNAVTALLVQEAGDGGMQWRLFRLIEPPPSITASEAATKRVGDWIDLTGHRLRVTCVDQSRVAEIEGQAPEGVEVGDIADYFNAESGNQMVVVSWTGSEVEVFRGIQLPGYAVQKAFNLDAPPSLPRRSSLGSATASTPLLTEMEGYDEREHAAGWKGVGLAVGVIAVLVGIIAWRFGGGLPDFGSDSRPVRRTVPKAALQVGQAGDIGGIRYRVTGHAEMEISRVGQKDGWHEYTLVDGLDATSLLVQGSGPDARWQWLRPVTPGPSFSAKEAGAKKLGADVSLGNGTVKVNDLFLTKVKSAEGATAFGVGTIRYGFEARGPDGRIVARWNDSVSVYEVTPATSKEIAAFQAK